VNREARIIVLLLDVQPAGCTKPFADQGLGAKSAGMCAILRL
jgi:hypothetical protein